MGNEMENLITKETSIKVSSTLDKSVGKKYLVDGSPETCWTSQQGLPQYIQFTFPQPVRPTSISFTFQGGFVGTRCTVRGVPLSLPQDDAPENSKYQDITSIYPEDVNRVQKFELAADDQSEAWRSLRIVFEESSDFFGRITVYDVKIEGFIVEL